MRSGRVAVRFRCASAGACGACDHACAAAPRATAGAARSQVDKLSKELGLPRQAVLQWAKEQPAVDRTADGCARQAGPRQRSWPPRHAVQALLAHRAAQRPDPPCHSPTVARRRQRQRRHKRAGATRGRPPRRLPGSARLPCRSVRPARRPAASKNAATGRLQVRRRRTSHVGPGVPAPPTPASPAAACQPGGRPRPGSWPATASDDAPPPPIPHAAGDPSQPAWKRYGKRGKTMGKQAEATLEMVYERDRWPSDDVVTGLWELHRIPRDKVRPWETLSNASTLPPLAEHGAGPWAGRPLRRRAVASRRPVAPGRGVRCGPGCAMGG